MAQTIEERAAAFADSKISGKVGKQCTAIGYIHGAQDQDRIARDEEREKAREAFCLATCKGELHRSTCTSLGTCDEYDEFCKIIRKAIEKG